MSALNVYAYANLVGKTTYVDDGDINSTGTWSSTGTYAEATRDVVRYGASQFICIVDNVGAVPTQAPRRNQTAKWSSLVLLQASTGTNHSANEAYALAAAAVPASGGVMTGNLTVPLVIETVGTVPTALAVNGTLQYDLSGPAFQETLVDRNVVVSAKNLTAGVQVCAVLVSDGAQRNILYDSNISWFSQVPATPLAADKKVLVTLTSIGTTAARVLGESAVQL